MEEWKREKGKEMEEWKREWVEGWKNVLQSVRIAEGTENTKGVERSTIKDECATAPHNLTECATDGQRYWVSTARISDYISRE